MAMGSYAIPSIVAIFCATNRQIGNRYLVTKSLNTDSAIFDRRDLAVRRLQGGLNLAAF